MKNYVIVDTFDVENSMINESTNTSISSLRLSCDGDKAILKFNDANIHAKMIFKDYVWYSKKEIDLKLKEECWRSTVDE